MLNTVATVVVVVLGFHVIIKFTFFALPYRPRRALLDKQYGDKPSATNTSDLVLMAFTVAVAGLLLWRGIARARRSTRNVAPRGDVVRDPGCAVAPVAPVVDVDRAGRLQPGAAALTGSCRYDA
jgi:hypothetical protein